MGHTVYEGRKVCVVLLPLVVLPHESLLDITGQLGTMNSQIHELCRTEFSSVKY